MVESRNAVVDLWRFCAMLMIMGHHQYHVGASGYHFSQGWIFVEFFFMLSGYLSTVHFAKKTSNNLDEMAKSSLEYTIKKFSHLLPFVLIGVLLEYGWDYVQQLARDGFTVLGFVDLFSEIFPEMMLVNSSYTKPNLVPIWYLSAMFIVFPLFCLLLQMSQRHLLLIISGIVPLVYYGAAGIADNWLFPLNLVRAFSALLLGSFVYEMNERYLKERYKTIKVWVLHLVVFICIAFPIIVCYKGATHVFRVIMLCFVIGLSVAMSGICNINGRNKKLLIYLGEISLPMYVFHWTIAGIVGICMARFSQDVRVFLYYSVTILSGVAAHKIRQCIKMRNKA